MLEADGFLTCIYFFNLFNFSLEIKPKQFTILDTQIFPVKGHS